jgi:hypothetical protein
MRISQRELMKDPAYRKLHNFHNSNKSQDIKERNSYTSTSQKLVDLLEGTQIVPVKSIINYE